VPLAGWFRRKGAVVVLVPPEQSADLRDYYSKHTKSDRVDARLLARLPLLHPEGLHATVGLGPGEPLRRATRLRSSLVKRRSRGLERLDALLELLGPGWREALGSNLANITPMRFLAAGYADPHVLRRLGRARLSRFLYRHSRGAWSTATAEQLLAVAAETLVLWDDELDYTDLAEDIAVEARLALQVTEQIRELDQRIAALLAAADPTGVLTSVPGVGPILAAQILGRLGDPNRFRSLAGARSFTGLVPSLDASGINGSHGRPTKAGDALLREAIFLAADHARRVDPTLAARYHRLMVQQGKHHVSALCHIAPTLLTRLITCYRQGQPYIIRDLDGTALTPTQGRTIVAASYTIPPEVRRRHRSTHRTGRTSRRNQESHSAPSTGPSRPPTLRPARA
jgi:transposase